MTEQGLHVVVGAGGASGRQVVRHLRAAGLRVRAVTRDGRDVGTPGVELVASDVTDQASLDAACRGARVVYHCVMPPIGRWLPDFPVLTDALLAAAAAAGARLVFADDTWMYGRVDRTDDRGHAPSTGDGQGGAARLARRAPCCTPAPAAGCRSASSGPASCTAPVCGR